MSGAADNNMYDAIIIGGGPAGLTAGIYLARACYRVLIVEKEAWGGQITITSEVVNYPGIGKTSGKDLTEGMRKQAESFGAEFKLAEVTDVELDGDIKKVITSAGTFECFGVIIATGAHPRMIGFKGEEEFKGHGVAYCATCDGEFFTGKEVFVVGGGFAAAEEAVFLTKYASHVTILVRGDDFKCAKSTADEAKNNPHITVLYNTEVEEVTGDSVLRRIVYKNNKTGEANEFAPENDTFGVFVFAGYTPSTDLFQGKVELDEHGYVLTDAQHKSSVDGVYAAGDVCIKNLRQVVTATGDGAIAATELEKYAREMEKKTGITPDRPQAGAKAQEESSSGAAASAAASENTADGGELFTADMVAQLNMVFERMEHPLLLKMYLDESHTSEELDEYIEKLAALTDKLSFEIVSSDTKDVARPCVKICKEDGSETGLAFHGVPGGHEFNSFVLGIYNASGAGQQLPDETKEKIAAIDKPVDMRIMVSLSCTMCPDLVVAAQKIASMNENVTAEVYDLQHFPDMKDKYNVMSVPCYIINDGAPQFGKKNVEQLLELIG